MQLTESFYMKRDKDNAEQFDQLTHWMKVSNDLYNQSLYVVKKYWEEHKGQPDQYDLKIDVVMKEIPNLDGEINYRLMPNASAAQQITRLLEQNMRSFYASLKSYREYPERWKARPQFPKFQKKGSRFLLMFTGQRAKIKGSKLQLTKDFFLDIPESNLRIGDDPLDQVRILPVTGDRIKIEMIYTIHENDLKPDNGRVLGIDLGVNNFATCVTNAEFKPFILDGRHLKSYNRLYNKKKAKMKSLLSKGQYNSRQLEELEFQRYCKIQDIFHLYSKRIIDFCLEHQINTVVIGRNKDWKQNCNMGKRNNQNFVQIPFFRFICILKYKCQLYGINFVETEESYTSKIDHLAKEPMCHHDSYLGKRVRRGLFQSSTRKLINADVNGAIGVIRKVFGDSIVREIADRGLLYRPIRIYCSRINGKVDISMLLA